MREEERNAARSKKKDDVAITMPPVVRPGSWQERTDTRTSYLSPPEEERQLDSFDFTQKRGKREVVEKKTIFERKMKSSRCSPHGHKSKEERVASPAARFHERCRSVCDEAAVVEIDPKVPRECFLVLRAVVGKRRKHKKRGERERGGVRFRSYLLSMEAFCRCHGLERYPGSF